MITWGSRNFWIAAVLVSLGAVSLSLKSLSQKLVAVKTNTSVFGTVLACAAVELLLNLFTSAVSCMITACRQPGKHLDCKEVSEVSWRSWLWLLTRSFSGFTVQVLEYVSLMSLPLATVSMIVYASPMFIVLWSAVLLCERIRVSVILCMLMCLAGLSLIVQPWNFRQGSEFHSYLTCMGCPLTIGLIYVALRQLKPVHYRIVINTYMSIMIVLALIAGCALGSLRIPLRDPEVLLTLFCSGIFDYLAEVCMTCGFAVAQEASGQVAVLKFLAPALAQVWGALFLNEQLTVLHVFGVVIVIAFAVTGLLIRSANSDAKGFPSVATSVHALLDESIQASALFVSARDSNLGRSSILSSQKQEEQADKEVADVA